MHKTDAHPCPPMNNNIAPMPTQNPWVWVGMDMGMGMDTQCRALFPSDSLIEQVTEALDFFIGKMHRAEQYLQKDGVFRNWVVGVEVPW